MNKRMGDNFYKYMNLPEEWNGQALKKVFPDGTIWIVCPFCYKKAIKILPETKIHKMPYKCGGSNCKKEFEISI